MDEEDLKFRVDVLSEHVALFEGVMIVILQEAEAGTLQSETSIRAALRRVEG